MPVKEDQNTLTYPQLTAFKHHQVDGKSIPETAELVGVGEKTIDTWKKKRAWRDLGIAALERQGHSLDDWAQKVIQMKDRKKTINVSGEAQDVEDNQAQIRYLDSVEKVFGLQAPQKHELVASPSDEELDRDLEEAAKSILPDGVDGVESAKQRTLPKDSEKGEGTPLSV